MEERIAKLKSGYLKALSHPTRLRILELLRGGEKCVCEIFPAIGAEQSNISRHLAILRKNEIVVDRKEGVRVLYRIKDKQVFEILDSIGHILRRRTEEQVALLKGPEGREKRP